MNKPETQTNTETSKKPMNLKKFKYGSMSLIVMVLVVVIVVILNIMAGYLSKRAPLKLDLTADNRYELSDETIDYLKNKLEKNVEIVVTCPKDEFEEIASSAEFYYYYNYGIKLECPYDMIPVLLEKYEMYANQGKGKLTVRYVDLDKDPKAVQKYREIYGSEIEAQSMVVSSGDRVRVITPSGIGGMIVPDTSNRNTPTLVFAGESTITSEIMNVTDANPITVAFASKFNGEAICSSNYADSLSGLRDRLLVKNGYFCTDIDIAADALDVETYDMLVIPMPAYDFDEKTIDKISTFLFNDGKYGKNMLFIADTLASELKNINELLEGWNIAVSTGTVVQDTEKFMGTNTFVLQTETESNEFTEALAPSSLYLVAPSPQEVQIISKNNDCVTVPVIKSFESAGNFDMAADKAVGKTGVKNIGVVSTRTVQISNFEYSKSNVMVLGCGLMTRNDILAATNLYRNSNVLLNVFNVMTGKETDTVVIPEKALQAAIIAPTAKQDKTIKLVSVFIIPALVAVIGIAVLLRRRNK